MFETAAWTTRNRRNFGVLEELFARVGMDVTPTSGLNLSDDTHLAAALANEVGNTLFYLSIGTASCSEPGKPSKRTERRAWKSVTPEDGARASVFLSLSTAAMISKELMEGVEVAEADYASNIRDIDPAPIEFARIQVEDAFAPPKGDLQTIETIKERLVTERRSQLTTEATKRGGLRAGMLVHDAQATLSFNALELAGTEPANMPAFEPVAAVDQEHWHDIQNFEWLMSSQAFAIPWRNAKDTLLELAFAPFR